MRETQEELGIIPEEIDVLGEIDESEFNLRGDMRVWPYVVSFKYLNIVAGFTVAQLTFRNGIIGIHAYERLQKAGVR